MRLLFKQRFFHGLTAMTSTMKTETPSLSSGVSFHGDTASKFSAPAVTASAS